MAATALNKDVDLVALDRGCGLWLTDRPAPLWLNATKARTGFHETLIIFFVGLLDSLRLVDLGEPSLLEMFYSDE